MPRFGVCAWIYGDAPLDETLARIAAAGYDGVEIPGEPGVFDPGAVRRALTRHGLTPVGLTASCTVPATRRDLAHPDPAIRADAVGYVVDCLRFAAEIGAPLTQMLPSGEPRLAPARLACRGVGLVGRRDAGRRPRGGAARRQDLRRALEPVRGLSGDEPRDVARLSGRGRLALGRDHPGPVPRQPGGTRPRRARSAWPAPVSGTSTSPTPTARGWAAATSTSARRPTRFAPSATPGPWSWR